MKGIAIVMSNHVEIVDVTVRGDAVFADHCPGDLAVPCTACQYAIGVHPPQVQHERPSPDQQMKAKQIIFFATCLWFDRFPDTAGRTGRQA